MGPMTWERCKKKETSVITISLFQGSTLALYFHAYRYRANVLIRQYRTQMSHLLVQFLLR